MIVSSFKLCFRNISGDGVNFKHCHEPARLKYVSSLDEPPCSSRVIAFIQSNEIVHFLVRPLKKKGSAIYLKQQQQQKYPLNFRSFRFVELLQRKYREFLYSPHPVSPIINLLGWYGTFVTSSKPVY